MMALNPFANLCAAAAITCAAVSCGHGILNVIGLRRVLGRERVMIAFAAGTMGVSLAALVIGYAGMLRPWPARIILAAVLVLSVPVLLHAVRDLRIPDIVRTFLGQCTLVEKTLVVIIVTQALLLIASAPALQGAGNRLPAQNGAGSSQLTGQPEAEARSGPWLAQDVLELSSALQSRPSANWLTPLLICATGAAAHLLARTFWPRKVGITACAVFLVTPQLASSAQLSVGETAMGFFVVTTFLALIVYRRSDESARTRSLLLVALLSGAAASTGRAGAVHLFLATPMILLIPILLQRERLRVVAQRAVLYAAVALVIAGGWYARSGVFSRAARLPVTRLAELAADKPDTDLGKILVALLTSPWSLTMRVQEGSQRAAGNPGPLPLAFIPLLLLLPDRHSRPLRPILFYCAAYVVYVFLAPQPGQTLLPILGLAAVATAVGIDRMSRLGPIAARVAVAAVIIAYAANVVVSAHLVGTSHARFPAAATADSDGRSGVGQLNTVR